MDERKFNKVAYVEREINSFGKFAISLGFLRIMTHHQKFRSREETDEYLRYYLHNSIELTLRSSDSDSEEGGTDEIRRIITEHRDSYIEISLYELYPELSRPIIAGLISKVRKLCRAKNSKFSRMVDVEDFLIPGRSPDAHLIDILIGEFESFWGAKLILSSCVSLINLGRPCKISAFSFAPIVVVTYGGREFGSRSFFERFSDKREPRSFDSFLSCPQIMRKSNTILEGLSFWDFEGNFSDISSEDEPS